MEKTESRNYGIDAMRICSMLMVVQLHVLLRGGILDITDVLSRGGLTEKYMLAWFLETAAICAVNCYALISGYVGVGSKYRLSNLAELWLRVVFYTVGITTLFSIFQPGSVETRMWIKAFFPLCTKYYWYFTAYAGLFLFIPILNIAIERLEKRQIQLLIAGFVVFFSCAPILFGRDIFGTGSGYSAWWLMILYIMGGYIRKYGLFQGRGPGWMFAGYFGMVVLTWAVKMALQAGLLPQREGPSLLSYISPTMLAAGVFLLLGFERLKLPKTACKVIRFLSPMAFSVYVIHVENQIWKYLDKRFAAYVFLPPLKEAAAIVGTVLAIYVICTAIDYFREKLFAALKVRQRLRAWEERLLP